MSNDWTIQTSIIVLLAGTGVLSAVVFGVLSSSISSPRLRHLPPGPPSSRISQKRFNAPLELHKSFENLSKKYGPICSFYVGSKPVIVLNTAKAAFDLLEKRGEIYSSRPRNIMGQEILSRNMVILGTAYGEDWRKGRKWLHSSLNAKYVHNYRPFLLHESLVVLEELMQDPGSYWAHFLRFSTSFTFAIAYGTRIVSVNDPRVVQSEESGNAYGRTTLPGRYIVESWPQLLWLPKILQWFRKPMEAQYRLDSALFALRMDEVKEKMTSGTAKPSMVMKMVEHLQEDTDDNAELKMAYHAAETYRAGAPTMTASLAMFILTAVLHPEAVRKAQDELDSVIGQDRLPNFEDESELPYVCAFIKEAMRWRVVAPTGLPHATTRDDSYMGYHIPSAATVYANINLISQDPELFPEPETFRPERFLNTTDSRLRNFEIPFGFGRRVCPGQHVSEATLFCAISRMLWAFYFLPALDAAGNAAWPDPNSFRTGVIRLPRPFDFRLQPRTEQIREIVTSGALAAQEALKEWD